MEAHLQEGTHTLHKKWLGQGPRWLQAQRPAGRGSITRVLLLGPLGIGRTVGAHAICSVISGEGSRNAALGNENNRKSQFFPPSSCSYSLSLKLANPGTDPSAGSLWNSMDASEQPRKGPVLGQCNVPRRVPNQHWAQHS